MKRKLRKAADRIGERHGAWTIIGVGVRTKTSRKFLCRCTCGLERLVGFGNLTGGLSRSCLQCRSDARSRRIRLANAKRDGAKTGTNSIGEVVRICKDCGTEIGLKSLRCKNCRDARHARAMTGKPKKYPVSIGSVARACGCTRQNVASCFKRHGPAMGLRLLAERYPHAARRIRSLAGSAPWPAPPNRPPRPARRPL